MWYSGAVLDNFLLIDSLEKNKQKKNNHFDCTGNGLSQRQSFFTGAEDDDECLVKKKKKKVRRTEFVDVGQHSRAKFKVGGPKTVQTQVDEGRAREPERGGAEGGQEDKMK